MELLATARRDGQAVAYSTGAALSDDGTRLHCGLLFVMCHQKTRTLIFRCPQTQERVRVRLPRELLGNRAYVLGRNYTLEVIK